MSTVRRTSCRISQLTRNASRNNADVSTSQGKLETIVFWQISSDLCDRGDVGQISSDTRSIDHIVEGKLVDEWGGFAEKGQWL